MSPSIATNMKKAVCAVLIASGLLAGTARADEIVFVPPEVIATTTPVYYNGVPAYWWNGRWYYRNGPGWGYYHDEPGFLHDWRGHHEPERRYYEGRGGPRFVNRGGGGWRR